MRTFEHTNLGFVEDLRSYDHEFFVYDTERTWSFSLGVNNGADVVSNIVEAFNSLQGNNETKITPEDAEKIAQLNPGQSYFVDSYNKIIFCLK